MKVFKAEQTPQKELAFKLDGVYLTLVDVRTGDHVVTVLDLEEVYSYSAIKQVILDEGYTIPSDMKFDEQGRLVFNK